MSPGTGDLRPPLLPVTEDDHGPWVIAVSTILLILSIMATVVTLISRIRVTRKISWGDFVLALGCVLFLPQTICINVASSHGIGKRHDSLTPAGYESYSKALYASQLLSVLVLACSKAAVVLLVLSLKPFEKISLACNVALGLIAAWAITALISLGLQCDQPHPWDPRTGRCVDQYALYVALAVTHILLDVMVTSLPIILLFQVQIIQQRRYHISALFAMRLFVTVLTIPAINSLQAYFHAKPLDRPWHALMPAIWLQLVQSASLLCTCIPTLKRALADLRTGMMAGTVSDFFETSVSGHSSGHGNTGDGSASKSGSGIGQRTGSARAFAGLSWSRPRVERVDSQTGLRGNVIVQSIDYEVRFEGAESHRASSTSHDLESVQGEIHPARGDQPHLITPI